MRIGIRVQRIGRPLALECQSVSRWRSSRSFSVPVCVGKRRKASLTIIWWIQAGIGQTRIPRYDLHAQAALLSTLTHLRTIPLLASSLLVLLLPPRAWSATTMSDLYPIPLGIAAYLGYSGYRKGSLSLDGAITASLVGYASMANPFVGYGLTLITFYLTGSRATKFKAQIKGQLETHAVDPKTPPPPQSSTAVAGKLSRKKRDTSSGNRSAVQVLCNSITAVMACVAFRVLNGRVAKVDPLSMATLTVLTVGTTRVHITNLLLTLIVAGHYAACMGDTLASELGILSKAQPRLITNPLRKVPKGTNGGVSPLGLAVSALGGTLIGLVQCFSLFIHYYPSHHSIDTRVYIKLVTLLTASGLTGSLIDSLLGATLQQTLYNGSKVLVGKVTDVLDGKKQDEPNASWSTVTGWNVLDNNAVNFVASTVTALGTAWIGAKLF